MKKSKIIKAWAIIQKNYLMNWIPQSAFTGALATFETNKKAKLAVEYNKKLEIDKGITQKSRTKFKVIPCEIKLLN